MYISRLDLNESILKSSSKVMIWSKILSSGERVVLFSTEYTFLVYFWCVSSSEPEISNEHWWFCVHYILCVQGFACPKNGKMEVEIWLPSKK